MRTDEREVYLIIGASSDVALAYIRHIASKYRKNCKYPPLILAHYFSNKEMLVNLAAELPSIELIPIQADLRDENQALKLVLQVEKYAKYPHYILHFPAMKFEYMRYREFNTDCLRQELNIQLYSFLVVTRAFLPLMHKDYGNRVLVMLSSYIEEELPPKFMPDYVIAKYALLGAMKAAAAEYGGKNLKINAISPIMMDTKFLDKMDPHIKELAVMKSKIGRIPRPEELIPFIDEMLDSAYMKNGFHQLIDETCFEAEETEND